MKVGQEGAALVLAVFVLVLVAGMGLALLFLSDTELRMSDAGIREKQAFYLAEAAVEDARLRLYEINGGELFDNELMTAFGSNDKLDLDPDTLRVEYGNDGVPTLTGFGDDVLLTPLTAFGAGDGVAGWYAAFLTNDPTEDDETADTDDRVMVTGVGIGPRQSSEIVQAIIEQQFLTPPAPPALVTMVGPAPGFLGGTSNAMRYEGDDCNGAGDPEIKVPTVGAFGPEARDDVVDGMGKDTTYRTDTSTGADTVVDLTDPDAPFVDGSTDPAWTDCMTMRDLMFEIRERADVVCNGPHCQIPPSTPTRIVFADGDFSAVDGQGLLAVSGALHVNLGWDWSGLVLVIGRGEVYRTGGGNGEFLGGIVVANIAGPDRVLFTDDDCSDGTDGFGASRFHSSGGGASRLSYCQASINAIRIPLPYRIVDFLQR